MPKCARCQETKGVEQFYFNKSRKRLNAYCYPCQLQIKKNYRKGITRKDEVAKGSWAFKFQKKGAMKLYFQVGMI